MTRRETVQEILRRISDGPCECGGQHPTAEWCLWEVALNTPRLKDRREACHRLDYYARRFGSSTIHGQVAAKYGALRPGNEPAKAN